MTDRRTFRDLTDPDEAAAVVADLPIAAEPERVPLREARGRVLAERVDASLDVPGFDRASLDGYALRAADTVGADEADPVELAVVGAVHAGEAPATTIGEGEAVGVSTGAVMPEGADAMVPIERLDEVSDADERGTDGRDADGRDAEEERSGARERKSERERDDGTVDDPSDAAEPDAVLVRTAVAPGENVQPAGADVAAGQRALGPGTRLGAREVGLLAAIGEETVPVRGQPTVGVLSTGAELVPPGEPLDHERGEIHDVNTETIATMVAAAGGEPRVYPRAGDDAAALAASLRDAAADCDLLLTSGSTSAGAVDVLHRVLEAEGELSLHGVALKPGKPTLVGRLGDCGYVGLPGYPVSAAMVFRTLVAPAIREAAGEPEPERATVEGDLATEARFEPGRRRLLPVGLVGRDAAEPSADEAEAATDSAATEAAASDAGAASAGSAEPLVYPVDRGSGATTSLARADGLVAVPASESYVPAGERVTVELFAPALRPPALLAIGEDDPGVAALLDRVTPPPDRDAPRYLPDGTDAGLRRLRDGVPDVAIAAEPHRRAIDAPALAAWTREWGLLVDPDAEQPADVDGLAALVDGEHSLANRARGSGLRSALDDALGDLAEERGVDVADLQRSIDGYGVGLRGHESPARRVLEGDADAGLGLAATADRLGLDVRPLGEQRVVLYAHPDRTGSAAVAALERALEGLDDVLEPLAGYEPADR